MKQFVKLTLLFSLALLILTVVLLEVSERYVARRADFKLRQHSEFIVIGHSHSECSFNDTLIENLTNLSGSGESYFYTYLKTKKVLEQNPSIKTVLIEYTNNQISPIMNDWTWDDEHINHRYPNYAPFMSLKEKMLLTSHNFKGFINSNSLSVKKNIGRIFSQDYQYLRKTPIRKPPSDQHILDSLILDAKKKGEPKKDSKVSKINVEYLQRIVQLCKEKGKQVILVRSPLHKDYRGYSNELAYQAIRKKYFADINYLDFSQFPLDNSHFYDLEHLNEKGANVFSNSFNSLLKEHANQAY